MLKVKDIVREDDGTVQELVLTLVATAEDVDRNAKKFFDEIAQRDIPGFRKGKAPRAVLEQSVGGHKNAMGGVAEMLINEMAFAALDEADVIFLGEPLFNVQDEVEEGKPFSFQVSGKVAPLVKLSSYEPVSIEMPPDEATEEEIEAQLKELQDYYHTYEDIDDPDHEAVMGDYAMITVTVTNHDKVVNGLRGVNRLVGLGTGVMPMSFDEKLVGAKAGEIREFDFEAKDEQGKSDLGDGDLHAVVEVQNFRRCIVPEIDDELAARMGCTDVEELRRQMEYTINQHKNEYLPKLMTERAVEALVERIEGEVPLYYVDFLRQDVLREFMQDLEKKGTSLQQWLLENKQDGEEIKEQVAAEAERRAAIDVALEALCAEKGWEITEEDIAKQIGDVDDPDNGIEAWKKAGRLSDVRKICRRDKAVQWLVKTAEVTVVNETE